MALRTRTSPPNAAPHDCSPKQNEITPNKDRGRMPAILFANQVGKGMKIHTRLTDLSVDDLKELQGAIFQEIGRRKRLAAMQAASQQNADESGRHFLSDFATCPRHCTACHDASRCMRRRAN